MKVHIKPKVLRRLAELFKALLTNGYFATPEKAREYNNKIYSFILSVPDKAQRKTRDNKWGNYYASYKPNRHTTWYITFDIIGDAYVVRNIMNNHTDEYPLYISDGK